jgi:hypothetical protein
MKKLASGAPRSLFAFVLVSVAVACGGSSSGDDGKGSGSDASPTSPAATSCAATTKALCAKACACAGSGKCTIAYGGGGASETHDSQEKCETFYSFMVCGDAKYASQYEGGCRAGVDAAQCTSAGSAGSGVAFPASACPKK